MATKPYPGIIYGLQEVGTTEIRYVGATTRTAQQRLERHYKQPHCQELKEWFDEVESRGSSVEAIELAKFDALYADGFLKESFWISLASIVYGERLINRNCRADFFSVYDLVRDSWDESKRQRRERRNGWTFYRTRGIASEVWDQRFSAAKKRQPA